MSNSRIENGWRISRIKVRLKVIKSKPWFMELGLNDFLSLFTKSIPLKMNISKHSSYNSHLVQKSLYPFHSITKLLLCIYCYLILFLSLDCAKLYLTLKLSIQSIQLAMVLIALFLSLFFSDLIIQQEISCRTNSSEIARNCTKWKLGKITQCEMVHIFTIIKVTESIPCTQSRTVSLCFLVVIITCC